MKSFRRVLMTLLPAVMGLWLVNGVVGGTPAGAASPSWTFTCTGTISNKTTPPTVNPEAIPAGTYRSLVMPPGSFCAVVGAVTVDHGIKLGHGSALIVVEGTVPGFGGPYSGALTVNGAVRVESGAWLGFNWDGTPFTVTPFTLNGPVAVETNALLGLLQAHVQGLVSAVAPSAMYLYGSNLSGGVNVLGGGGLNNPQQAFVRAGLATNRSYRFIDVEGNQIGGPFTVVGYSNPGSSYGYAMVAADNTVHGPVAFMTNSVEPPGTYSIGSASNTIYGSATCKWNGPVIDDIAPSTVTGPILGAQGHLCFG